MEGMKGIGRKSKEIKQGSKEVYRISGWNGWRKKERLAGPE